MLDINSFWWSVKKDYMDLVIAMPARIYSKVGGGAAKGL